MKKWTRNKDIIKIVEKKWLQGDVLRAQIDETYNPFPLLVKLKGPNKMEMSDNYIEVKAWINELRSKQKKADQLGYTLIEKEVNYRDIGRNSIPVQIRIDSINDFMSLTKHKQELKEFMTISKQLVEYDEGLKAWIIRFPHKLLTKIGNNIEKYIAVVDWFTKNKTNDLYIRQFDIERVDTKFIENNKKTISELLDTCLPQERIDNTQTNFEKRYQIKTKEEMIRFRLHSSNCPLPFTDVFVKQSEFEVFKPNIKKIFMLENEINYLCFPDVEDSLIIFTRGYHIESLANTKWLNGKDVYYWGDIDTHGFNILSRLRKFCPNAKSFLMDEATLINHIHLTGQEEKQFSGEINLLTDEEATLVEKLQTNYFKNNLRLEQERIEYKYVLSFIETL